MVHLNRIFGLLFILLFCQADQSYGQVAEKKDTVVVGTLTRKELSACCGWFGERYNKSWPNQATVEAIKPYAPQLRFILVVGTWCSDTKEHIPPFFKIIDSLNIPDDRIEIYAVNRKKERKFDKKLKRLKFEYLPTIIVYYNNKEIGRIVEDTKVSVEKDLLAMLQKVKLP